VVEGGKLPREVGGEEGDVRKEGVGHTGGNPAALVLNPLAQLQQDQSELDDYPSEELPRAFIGIAGCVSGRKALD
jgi:hypothetical protein